MFLGHILGGWIRGLGKGVFGMWAFKAHHGLSKPIMGFCFQKNGPHIFGRTELVGTLPQAPFFSRKMAPRFLEALSLWVRCRRRLFFQKNGPQISGSPELVGTLPQASFFFRKMAPRFLGHFSGNKSPRWALKAHDGL